MSTHQHEGRTDGEHTVQHPAFSPDLDTTPTSEVPQSVITIKDPPQDPPPPNGSFITIANSTDYFTSDPTVDKRLLEDDDYSHPARPSTLPPLITQHSQAPVKALVKGSDAAVPGTIVVPGSYRSRQSLSARPSSRRDTKNRFHHSMDEHSPPRHDDAHEGISMSASGTLPPRPPYPNQAYAALHTQHHPVRNVPPVLRQRSSHPNHSLTLSGVAPFHQYHSGSRTVGNSPANTPAAGLYSPRSAPIRDEWESPETPGTYASPYLHPTHRQAPKETHVADVDVDPISGRKLINHYEIVDELGRGTHGKVKLGRDLETENTYVAIKIVERYSKRRRLGKLGNPEDKVKKEVAILKKARHPNVVALLEVIDDPTRKKVYIVLEWVSRGAIQWRAKGVREIAMLEARRYERERLGQDSEELLLKDRVLETEVQARLKRRRRERHSLFRAAMKERDPDRGIDHFGSNDLESDDDTLSRISTATNIAAAVEIAVQPDSTEVNNDTPMEVPSTPTLAQPSLEINTSDMLNALNDHHIHEDLSSGTASPYEASEELRSWATELLETELNPELEYVPCMTLQNIRVAFRDTLLGLQYLHYQGIVHRDIKPPNLLQTGEGRVKISDFGVSYLGRPIHDGDEPEAISESEAKDLDEEAKELAKTVGTPAFYAPELCITDHLEDHPPVTKAIDAWALGVTLFCMIFARTPFVDTEFVVMRQIADEDIYIPRRRLKPVDEEPKSRSSSRSRTYSPTIPDKRSELALEYEEIDDDLHDLLKRLLTKDPRKRILLETVRHHPWTVADLPNKLKWLEETDLNRQSQNQKIEVSKEDLNTAVVPLQFLERMRSGIKKIGDRLLGSSTRGRSTSSANSGVTSQPVSAHSSSSTISQDARRRSLRGDEIFSALRASREAEQLHGQTSTADHEKSNRAFFDEMPPTPAPYTSEFGAPLTQAVSHDSAARPGLPGRSRTGASTTASIRTIRQSDIPDYGRSSTPPLSPGLPSTPRAIGEQGITNLSGLLGGSGRNVFKTIRERSQTRGSRPGSRATSTDRRSIGSADAYAEPSLAVSETVAAGRVEAPELLPVKTPASSASNSVQHSPVALRPQSMVMPSDYRAGFSLSRQSSVSSVKSTGARPTQREAAVVRPQPRSATTVSTAEEWRRADEERTRRLILEARAPQKVSTVFVDRDCPPSPDDARGRQPRDTRRISDFDIDRPPSSHETSPTTNSTHMQPSSLVSSTSDFGSAVSATMSNPSIPSVISEATSVDAADGLPIEELEAKSTRSAGVRIPTRTLSSDKSVDEGYNPDMDIALDSDNDDSDADTDSDGGLTMSRRKSNTKLLLSSSPRPGSLSAAIEASRLKERRGTGLSKSSKKSSRSGSNNTMKKVRTRDSIDERRRPSFETSDARDY